MIRIEQLAAHRGKFLLGPVDLDLDAGGYLVILGPSGAGKTVLLEVCLGLAEPSGGKVWMNGVDTTDLPPERRRIAYLPQDLALFPHLSVRDNILFAARLQRLAPETIQGRMRELVDMLDLDGILDRPAIQTLSGGEKQRVALARALLPAPQVLFLDEPFSALDATIKRQLQIKLRQINREMRVTVLHVTHDQEEAFLLGERIAVMISGKLHQVGCRDDIYYHPESIEVARFLRNQNILEMRVEEILRGGALRLAGAISLTAESCAGVHAGDRVAAGIRSEEVVIIRPNRPVGEDLRENLFDGRVVDILGFGGNHILTVEIEDGVLLNAELPNCAFRDLGYTVGDFIQVALRRRGLWVLPITSEMLPLKGNGKIRRQWINP